MADPRDGRKGRGRGRAGGASGAYPERVLVRLATLEDAGVLAAAMAQVADDGDWLATQAPVDLPAAELRFQTAAVSPAHALWVLEDDDGRVAGCLGLHPTHATGVATLGMFVLGSARGRGGGRALLEAGLAHARSAELHKVELEVWPENARAIGLYARTGFAVEGLRRDHYRRRDGSLRSALMMGLAVGSATADPVGPAVGGPVLDAGAPTSAEPGEDEVGGGSGD
ncbi:MAG: L-phenylalanine/L-methionine N-acetyltransferase [Solirubrobacteraceae bacterium]|nr:L-phenylalanine/L-methionine N-acetyltransferase [Solirubrobacteraceae bacterium]